ncbi:MAG: LysR family transcriptional regulator [Pseudomonadota bacterium]
MDETNFDWDDLRLFLAVARGGGLAAATASTRKSAPTLGRRILSLERRLGLELFRRMPRGYELTEDGRDLLAKAEALEDRIVPIVKHASGLATPVVKISAGTWVTHILCGAIGDLRAQDRVRLRFVASDQVLDIGRREVLIGVRNRRPEGPGLAGRRIGRVRFAVYAVNKTVQTWARVIGSTPSATWVKEQSRDDDAIELTDPRNALDLTLAGKTQAVLPTFLGRRFTTLTQRSEPLEELDHDQWLVTHHEDRFVPEVRRVIDRLYGVLRQNCATA